MAEKINKLAKYTTSIAALEQQVVLDASLVAAVLTLFLTCILLHKCTQLQAEITKLQTELEQQRTKTSETVGKLVSLTAAHPVKLDRTGGALNLSG
jgi:hypothetical protein